jgi:hypothetical protein
MQLAIRCKASSMLLCAWDFGSSADTGNTTASTWRKSIKDDDVYIGHFRVVGKMLRAYLGFGEWGGDCDHELVLRTEDVGIPMSKDQGMSSEVIDCLPPKKSF